MIALTDQKQNSAIFAHSSLHFGNNRVDDGGLEAVSIAAFSSSVEHVCLVKSTLIDVIDIQMNTDFVNYEDLADSTRQNLFRLHL
jgi:hypothetical protein